MCSRYRTTEVKDSIPRYHCVHATRPLRKKDKVHTTPETVDTFVLTVMHESLVLRGKETDFNQPLV